MFDPKFVELFAEAVAQRTANLVLKELGTSKRDPMQRWGDINQAARRMGLKSALALRQRKQSGRLPQQLYRKMGSTVHWDLWAIDDYMANLPSE